MKFITFIVFCAISKFAFAATLSADGSFDGKTLDAKVGDVIEIKLDGNPTTGYSWSTTKVDGASIKQDGEPQYKQAQNDGRVGGGGTFTFKFSAEKAGQSTLNLGYARPWEKVDPVKKFSLTIKVADNAPATQPATRPANDNRGMAAKIARAKTDIKNIENAIEMFNVDNGRYPSQAEGLKVLVQKDNNLPGWHGPYINKLPVDPWGNDYTYKYPGTQNPNSFDILSAGPNGIINTPDDIVND